LFPNATILFPKAAILFPNAAILFPNAAILFPNAAILRLCETTTFRSSAKTPSEQPEKAQIPSCPLSGVACDLVFCAGSSRGVAGRCFFSGFGGDLLVLSLAILEADHRAATPVSASS
jgi:hypothetical protein